MFRTLSILFICRLTLIHAIGRLIIWQSPASFQFKSSDGKFPAVLYYDFLRASVGRSPLHHTEWNDVYLTNAFDVAQGVVSFELYGIQDQLANMMDLDLAIIKYQVTGHIDNNELFGLTKQINDDNFDVYLLDLSNGTMEHVFNQFNGTCKINRLNVTTHMELILSDFKFDKRFEKMMEILLTLSDCMNTIESLPELITIRLRFPNGITPAKVKILEDVILFCSQTIENRFPGKVLVTSITENAVNPHNHNIRLVRETQKRGSPAVEFEIDSSQDELNLAPEIEEVDDNLMTSMNLIFVGVLAFLVPVVFVVNALSEIKLGNDIYVYSVPPVIIPSKSKSHLSKEE